MIGSRAAWLLALLPLWASAQVYTYIDEHGNRVFTDRPRGHDARSVELSPTNAMPPPAPPAPHAESAERAPIVTRKLSPARYQSVSIVSPAPDDTRRDNQGNLNVVATSEPPLRPGDHFRLLLDGTPAAESGNGTLSLSNIDRGTHTLVVEILGPDGSVLGASPSQPVHIKRMSLAQRRRAQPCQKDDYGVRPECPLKDKPVEKNIPFVPFL
ncbi:DUF4124 domain-containing protein [Stutzerimonas urumqiensis]|uniref:DUF4124 domain-containing protein n=1 Tax=Stutzerimonas urumqiensis TaxID=638269 RepID=UPI000EABC671|nr:DUF4124 domain-containing protein [Stutzerimonas urumqiensis]